jgi:hypothetical protein
MELGAPPGTTCHLRDPALNWALSSFSSPIVNQLSNLCLRLIDLHLLWNS